jgi:hypothetical protein
MFQLGEASEGLSKPASLRSVFFELVATAIILLLVCVAVMPARVNIPMYNGVNL